MVLFHLLINTDPPLSPERSQLRSIEAHEFLHDAVDEDR